MKNKLLKYIDELEESVSHPGSRKKPLTAYYDKKLSSLLVGESRFFKWDLSRTEQTTIYNIAKKYKIKLKMKRVMTLVTRTK